MSNILVVDDEDDSFEIIRSLLAVSGHRAAWARTKEGAIDLMERVDYDCVLVDYFLGSDVGLELVEHFQKCAPFCPVLLLTGNGSEDLAADSIRSGAANYLRKSALSVERLERSITSAIAEAAERRAAAQDREAEARRGRLEALGQLAGGIAHDMNNLLASVQYTLASVPLAEIPAPFSTRLSSAIEALQGGERLTQRLIAFAANRPGSAEPCHIIDILGAICASAAALLGPGIALRYEAADRSALVLCDPTQLEHALLNLILNARDAIGTSKQGGEILITASGVDADGSLSITVTDDGPGMSEHVAQNAIDPYFTTKPRGKATGLGLSMVYGFVQQSGGTFNIATGEGRGTSISFTLPCPVGRQLAPLSELPVPAPQVAAYDEPSRAPRILLVDDEYLLLFSMALTLEDFGYEVLQANSGETGLEVLRQDRDIDLVITDIHLGAGMNGFEFARNVRSNREDIAILYISGYTGYSKDEIGAVTAPLIPKPCMPEALHKHIQDTLSARNLTQTSAPKIEYAAPGGINAIETSKFY